MKVNQLKAGVLLSYAQLAISAVISLIYTPVMLTLLGDSEFGLYNIASSIIAQLGLLNLGFGSSYVRYFSKYKVKNDEAAIQKLNGVYLITYTVLGAIAFICGIILCANVGLIFDKGLTSSELTTAKILLQILTVNLTVTFIFTVFSSYITANEKFIFQKLIIILKTVTGPLVSIPVMLYSHSSIGLVIVMTAVSIICEFINMAYCVSHLKMKFLVRSADFRLLREIFVFSFFIAINALVDQINWSIDKILLGRYRGTAEVTIYGIAAQLNTIYLTVASAVSSVFVPRVHALINIERDNKATNSLFIKVSRIQLLILGLVITGFTIFGREFITVWVGDGKESVYYIALLLLVPVTIPLTQNLGIEIQRAMNMHKFRSLVYLGMAVINFLMSVVLCQTYGAVGSAVGTAIAIIIANILIMNIYYHKKTKINMINYYKNFFRILPSILIPLILGFTAWHFIGRASIAVIGVSIIIYSVIYFASIWFLSMNTYEKDLILSYFKRFSRK